MTPNKQVVERYMDGFRKGDHAQILSCWGRLYATHG